MLLGMGLGLFGRYGLEPELTHVFGHYLLDIGKLILRLLSMIALPLIFVAIVHALITAEVGSGSARRLIGVLVTNTLVAICFGLLVANLVQPGLATNAPSAPALHLPELDLWEELKRKIPESFFGALVPNWSTGQQEIIPAILIAVGLGLAMRRVRARERAQGLRGVDAIAELFESFYQIFFDCP
jgi:DAACS family dicarboxylate/amino acid:cation (Na+ or H+) symporter